MTSADPNIILAIDDSGSMDFETLFLSNDGVLHWNEQFKVSWAQTHQAKSILNPRVNMATFSQMDRAAAIVRLR